MISLARLDSASPDDSALLPTSSSSNGAPRSFSPSSPRDGVGAIQSEQDCARHAERDEGAVAAGIPEAFAEPTSARSLSKFPAFVTPPLSLSPRTPVSSPSLQNDTYTTTPPTTQVSPPSRFSFSPASSSPLVSTLFDPVVGGGGSGGGKAPGAPIRCRVYSMRTISPARFGGDSCSLPTSPLASPSSSASLFSPNVAEPSQARVTWPPRPLACTAANSEPNRSAESRGADTPTKQGKSKLTPQSLVSEPARFDLFERVELATRYVLVEGIDKSATEQELKRALVHPYKHLSLKGCTSSRLDLEGTIVLAFHDVRHSLFAARQLASPQSTSVDGGKICASSARCVTREAFEQLYGNDDTDSLLSTSEGVLVYTASSSRTTPPPLLSIYGEIRSSKIVEAKIHVVEFFDDRSAEKALRGLRATQRGGMSYECSFEPSVTSSELPTPSPFDLSAIPALPAPRSTPRFAPTLRPLDPFSPAQSPSRSPQFASLGSYRPAPPSCSPFSTFSQAGFGGAQSSPVSIWQSDRTWQDPPQQPYTSPWYEVNSQGGSERFGLGQVSSGPRFDRSSLYGSEPFSPPLSPQSATFRPGPSDSYAFPPIPSASRSRDQPRSPVKQQGPAALPSRSRLPPSFGIVRDDRIPVGNVINYERIEQGLEVRTTLMLKNVPNKLKDIEVMAFIEEVVGRSYDFFYLRTDYATGCNVGYGFVNFTSMSALLTFCRQRLGTRWNLCNSDKLCILSFANIQGKASLINHFKNSSVLDQDESRRPKLFVTSGPNAGQPETFPVCDDPVRKMRSALNAANVGLFPSQKPVFKIAQAFQGMNL